MPRKRKLLEFSDDVASTISSRHGSAKKQKGPAEHEPQIQLSQSTPRPRPVHKPNSKHGSQPTSNPNSLNSLKTRIRNLKRLLEHTNHDKNYKMPAGVRVVRERELATCEHDLAEKTKATKETKHRQKMIGRYHQVRFFERQKATRVLKKIRREAGAATEPTKKEEMLQKLHIAEVNLNYTLYYPLMQPYSALFPKNGYDDPSHPTPDFEDPSTRGREADCTEESLVPLTTKGDRTIWKAVERAMELGTLDDLRNSKALVWDLQTVKRPQVKKNKNDSRRNHVLEEKRRDRQGTNVKSKADHVGIGNTDNEDSDGGFFE